MRKNFTRSGAVHPRDDDGDKLSLGNLDLVNLRLNLPSGREERLQHKIIDYGKPYSVHTGLHRHEVHEIPEVNKKFEKGYGNSPKHPANASSDDFLLLYPKDHRRQKIVKAERITEKDFLYPSKKKTQKAVDVFLERAPCKINQARDPKDSKCFPFKPTPSGNLKVDSSQVVFSSKKLSVLVADPKNTKVKICEELPMTHEGGYRKAISGDAVLGQPPGLSSLGSLIANTPARSANKEASEYESKQTNEILDPELNLGRLGYNGTESINWDKVNLPEKQNLYIELYRRITTNTNADCKVYINNEEFSCHLIVLQCYSELFDAYVAVKKVELPVDKCSVSAFAFIYEWMVINEPSCRNLNRENVLDIFIAAKYLKIKDLVEQCWAFIDNVDVFNEDTAFLLYMDAKRRNLPEVKEVMLPRIQNFFLTLVSSQDWLEMDIEDVKNILKSNYISVNCEMEIFMSAVRWLKHDPQVRDEHKHDVMECVRFGNVAPWQLVDIKRNPENPDFMELAKDSKICKMLDDGLAYVIIKYWYGQENEDFQHWNTVLGLQEPAARNWIGPDKTYFTYREFLIYLDQYRRNQLVERNKPKVADKEKKIKEAKYVSENVSPRIPTMEDFMAKKKSPGQLKKINKVMS
ncbi:uncharacterized protein LOC132703365 isoform X2 [Cylas formicarius]|uniref:uncharacterized protein LOC132703365 isoform X2 n=1 Tax=Cylas formicarius TaxID=197179 RepID=UPI002958BD1F|nr:uncharacterized protein LOC132703365 isoform X2 [Cylas formicarius]